jgi:hypothetical protein
MAKTRTVAEVLTTAYSTLNDTDRARYTEAEAIGFTVDALQLVRNVRPDLFLGQFSTAIGTLTKASVLPIDDQFFRPVADYVIARCETKDDEHVNSARAEMMAKFTSGFLT